MIWKVKIHRLVIEKDFKKLDDHQKKKIIQVIRKKLSKNPEQYGEPLRGLYKNYQKLKIGEYRAIYRIIKDKILVLVIKVGIRKDYEVYDELFHRLKKLEQ